MSTRTLLTELRRRGVLKVAVAYAAIGWVLLQVLSLLFDNFDAPGWVIKVVTTLVILGFPVACLMSWGFDITPDGVRPVPPVPKDPSPSPALADVPAAKSGVAAGPPSIAVLPFEDMSAEHDQQYLGDGIAEELLNALTAVEGLKVAARTSSFSFRGKSAAMQEIGEVLRVRHVLEGSVRRSGPKLRVTAQLVEVASGFHLFSQSYDRELADIFDIQNEIAREIVRALLPRLGMQEGERLVSQGTASLEAYKLHLEARGWLYNPDPTTADAAIALLRRAVAADPRYADAWADLGYIYGYLSTWTGEPVPLMLEFVRAATTALVHDPTSPLGLTGFAYTSMLIDRDPQAAASWYERGRAAGADPSIWAFHKAYVFDAPLGRYEEAIAQLTAAEARDPLAPNIKQALADNQLHSGRIREAVATAEAVEKLPSFGPEISAICGLAHVAAGDLPRASRLLEAARARSGRDFMALLPLALAVNAATADVDDTRRLLARLLEHHAEGTASSAYLIGEAYKYLGDFEKAFEWWNRSVERYECWSLTVLPLRNRNHPVIGKDPRFHALLRRMGLE
jgi:TolB-like protein/Tfp pilus assembly protein PilF